MANKEAALVRIRRLEEQVAKKKAELIRERGKLSEKERKARVRRLIQLGGLVEIAELDEADHGFLLGLLLSGKSIAAESVEWRRLKTSGDAFINERETAQEIRGKG